MADARSVAEAYYGALERNDFAAVTSTIADDGVVQVPGGALTGPAQTLAWMQAFADAFPDIKHEVSFSVDGDAVHGLVTVRGTHTAPLVSPDGAIPATNRPIEIAATNEMKVAGDRIAALTIDFDQADFMKQLGLG